MSTGIKKSLRNKTFYVTPLCNKIRRHVTKRRIVHKQCYRRQHIHQNVFINCYFYFVLGSVNMLFPFVFSRNFILFDYLSSRHFIRKNRIKTFFTSIQRSLGPVNTVQYCCLFCFSIKCTMHILDFQFTAIFLNNAYYCTCTVFFNTANGPNDESYTGRLISFSCPLGLSFVTRFLKTRYTLYIYIYLA